METLSSIQKFLVEYNSPPWTAGLQNVPTHRVKFAQCNTPIEKWNLPGVPEGFEVYIKREDLTGGAMAGNKVRCLEFVVADAIRKGCTVLIACGPALSNSIRTLAVMARSVGLQFHILLKTDQDITKMEVSLQDPDSIPYVANYLLTRLMGGQVYLIPEALDYEGECARMRKLADKIRKETGQKVYPIIDGENPWMFGYINVFQEMMAQGLESFTDIVSASSTGGTSAGLAIANHLTGNKLKIHGMVASETAAIQHTAVNSMLRYVGLQNQDHTGLRSEDMYYAVDGPEGAGYGVSTSEELEFIKNVARKTGIILSPVYVGKAAYYLVKMLNNNPEMFKGKKILFIHTGGMPELFDGRMSAVLENDEKPRVWKELTDDPVVTSKS